ncbi:MAG: IS3 family transposase, partial [Thermodesulfobacteriota bacterium]|nr:IS3 family transposase [Thermodesulfobacteriota bacterium]
PYQVELEAHIKELFYHSKASYGSLRIAKNLQSIGYQIGRYRARSLMRELGLKVKNTKHYKVTTDSR